MKKNLTYKDSGVDIEKSDEFVEFIKRETENQSNNISNNVSSNLSNNVIAGVGGFASLFSIKDFNYEHPVIVSSTDGVGTKILIAKEIDHYNDIGIDLVAMCVNDLLCHGALPLFFLDYYATGKLDVNLSKKILKSILTGCKIANIQLVGGETAEMPGLYQDKEIDLAGFAVGIVDKKDILPSMPSNIKSHDRLIGIRSSGLHSNGFSLIRKLFDNGGIDYNAISPWNNKKWFEILLEPTKIYVNEILKIKHLVKGIAHITGGGIVENVKRIIPSGLNIDLSYQNWPDLFKWIMEEGNITNDEMLKTFNCGIGMVVIAHEANVKEVLEHLENLGSDAFEIGKVG